MIDGGWLAIATVVMAQCGAYFLGLFRGRPEPSSRRQGLACVSFAFYAGAHAARATPGTLAGEAIDAMLQSLSTLLLVPGWVTLASGLEPRLAPRIRPALVYGALGAAAVVAHTCGLRPVALERPITLPLSLPARTLGDALALAYLLLGVALAMGAAIPLARSPRAASRTIAATMGLALLAALHDLYRLVSPGIPGLPWLDPALMILALACLDGTIRRTTLAGDVLQTKTDELAHSYAELRSTQERLVRNEQLAAVGELSAVIAHEVRNPLAIIKNALSGLRRKNLQPADRSTLLDILDEETDKLNRLMHDLLAYARPVAPRLDSVDLDAVLRLSVERAFGGVVAPVGLEVRFESEGELELLVGDPELLVQAFVNVIENALQAMPDGGTLGIRTRRATDGHRASIAVDISDTGEGMDTIVRAKARDPFFTTRPTGTGLGLAIVERVVRNHGGRIEITSSHGDGTSVTIYLPLDRHSLQPLPSLESSTSSLVLPRGST